MNTINIGTEINLQNLIESRLLIQANSGGGKSFLARVIMEEVCGKIPFIVFDRDGEYYTLKELYGDILIIGGQYADVPISSKALKLLVKEIISNRLSVIIDLSDMKGPEKRLYVKGFLDVMMDLPKEFWIAYLVFLEEAHFFCGEQDKFESGPAVKELMSGGRKKGYCGILITQRISKLHKDAAAECNNKFVGRTFLDIDMDRSAKELGFSSSKDRLQLRDLQPGHFYAFGTSINPHHVHEVTIRLPKTKHPKAGSITGLQVKQPTEKIKSILNKLSELPKEAAKELQTIQQLQTEVNRLRSELKKPGKPVSGPVNNSQVEKVQKQLEDLKFNYNDLKGHYEDAKRSNADLILKLKGYIKQEAAILKILGSSKSENIPNDIPEFRPKQQPVSVQKKAVQPTNGTVTGGAMRMLKASAMFHPNPVSKTRMAALAGLSYTSGSFSTYLSTLKREGLITGEGNEFEITDEGLAKVGDFEPLPTDPEALIEMWCNNVGSGSGAARILKYLGEVYPNQISKEQLGSEVGMSHTSGSFSTYLSTLKRNGLIETKGGAIKAADELFN